MFMPSQPVDHHIVESYWLMTVAPHFPQKEAPSTRPSPHALQVADAPDGAGPDQPAAG